MIGSRVIKKNKKNITGGRDAFASRSLSHLIVVVVVVAVIAIVVVVVVVIVVVVVVIVPAVVVLCTVYT